jgi:hypothetical protein
MIIYYNVFDLCLFIFYTSHCSIYTYGITDVYCWTDAVGSQLRCGATAQSTTWGTRTAATTRKLSARWQATTPAATTPTPTRSCSHTKDVNRNKFKQSYMDSCDFSMNSYLFTRMNMYLREFT